MFPAKDKPMDIPVFIINLKSSEERKKFTCEHLEKVGVTPQIIDAVDGNDITDEEVSNNANFGIYKTFLHERYLLKQELGCFLSHLRIYRKMVDENIPLSCILEDDAICTEDFGILLKSIELSEKEWDILYAGHHSGESFKGVKSFRNKPIQDNQIMIGEPIEPAFGSYGYFIRKKAAVILLAKAFPINKPFDSYLGSSNKAGLKMRIITPACIIHNDGLNSTVYGNKHFTFIDQHSNQLGKVVRILYSKIVFFRKTRLAFYKLNALIIQILIRMQIIRNIYS